MLDVEHARDEDSGIRRDQSPRLEDKLTAERRGHTCRHPAIGCRIGRRLVVLDIGHTEAASQIKPRDRVPVGAQLRGKLDKFSKSALERFEIDDLASDMHVNADDLDAF